MDVGKAEEVVKACDELIKELKDEKVIMPCSGYAISQLIKELKEMPILLSDEEIDRINEESAVPDGSGYVGCFEYPHYEDNLLKAQLKKVVEWGDKDCTEHPKTSDSYNKTYYLARSDCPECMEALKKEAGLT